MQPLLETAMQNARSMSWIEWVAAVTSFLCVWLTVRNNIWNWFWGFIGVVLYGVVFWNYKNYANCGLQILYFLPIQFIGWYVWLRCGPNKNDDLPVTLLSPRVRLGWSGATVALTGILWIGLRMLPRFGMAPDPLPFADGLTTAMSIVAQYLQVHKKIENWWLWIAVDVIYSAYVFPVQKLYVSTVLYILFTLLAIKGSLDWVKILRAQEEARNLASLRAEEEAQHAEPVRPYA